MPETATESFCERCGTRYVFEPPRPERKRLPFGRPFGRARDEQRPVASTTVVQTAADPSAGVLRFCLECRQYTCTSCWNDDAGFCQGCAPREDDAGLQPELMAVATERPEDEPQRPTVGPEAWPLTDLRAGAVADGPADRPARLVFYEGDAPATFGSFIVARPYTAGAPDHAPTTPDADLGAARLQPLAEEPVEAPVESAPEAVAEVVEPEAEVVEPAAVPELPPVGTEPQAEPVEAEPEAAPEPAFEPAPVEAAPDGSASGALREQAEIASIESAPELEPSSALDQGPDSAPLPDAPTDETAADATPADETAADETAADETAVHATPAHANDVQTFAPLRKLARRLRPSLAGTASHAARPSPAETPAAAPAEIHPISPVLGQPDVPEIDLALEHSWDRLLWVEPIDDQAPDTAWAVDTADHDEWDADADDAASAAVAGPEPESEAAVVTGPEPPPAVVAEPAPEPEPAVVAEAEPPPAVVAEPEPEPVAAPILLPVRHVASAPPPSQPAPAAPSVWTITAPETDEPRAVAWPPRSPVYRPRGPMPPSPSSGVARIIPPARVPAPAAWATPGVPTPSATLAPTEAVPSTPAWEVAARAERASSGIRPCARCTLPLSATARFCRRCGSPQA